MTWRTESRIRSGRQGGANKGSLAVAGSGGQGDTEPGPFPPPTSDDRQGEATLLLWGVHLASLPSCWTLHHTRGPGFFRHPESSPNSSTFFILVWGPHLVVLEGPGKPTVTGMEVGTPDRAPALAVLASGPGLLRPKTSPSNLQVSGPRGPGRLEPEPPKSAQRQHWGGVLGS